MNSIIYISIICSIIFIVIYSCKPKSESTDIEKINPNKIVQNEIVHQELTKEQIEKIKKIQSSFADVYKISLEETITNFKRDQNPDNEINIWLNMLNAYEKFIHKNGNEITLDKKQEVFKLILMRSMMEENEAKTETKCIILNENEINEIFSYYKIEAKPLVIEKR
ncbi:hypothetical protein [Flavobacterium sp.]|uniref:hypothetical protein n=1 Tax=Flavobacterium sp. TaxID=239 RepID=UPI0040474EDC